MSGRVFAAAAAASALSLVLTLSGCVGPSRAWQFPPLTNPPQAAYTPPRYNAPQPPPPASQSSEVGAGPTRETTTNLPPRELGAIKAPPPPAPPAEAAPQPTVSLSGDGADRERALRLLDDAGARLAKIDRNKLGRDSAATYDQANDFLNAGRKAALDQDYVAATGDAEKASVLADKLKAAAR